MTKQGMRHKLGTVKRMQMLSLHGVGLHWADKDDLSWVPVRCAGNTSTNTEMDNQTKLISPRKYFV